MKHFTLALIMIYSFEISAQVTQIKKKNALLSRHKRYLTFPSGSNFVISLSAVKDLMAAAPKGIKFLGECDVPFALPSDTRFSLKNHFLQKRELFSNFEILLQRNGLNGTACVEEMICDGRKYIDMMHGSSLIKNLLSAVFRNVDYNGAFNYENNCNSFKLEKNLPIYFRL